MPWYVAWAPIPSNGWLGEVYIGPNSTSRWKAGCCKGGTPDSPVSQRCANCVPTVCSQRLVLTHRTVRCTNSVPTVSQLCATGEPTVCHRWANCVPMVCSQRLVLTASRYVHRTVNSDCPVHTGQSGASSQKTLLAVLWANCVPPVRQLCATGEPTVCHRCASWQPIF
jgi:hypothetical protein